MITSKIILDSINPAGIRLTTFEVTYPRFIHAEIMTHRALSRNAASSRAIPIEKMIKAVEDKPATPEYWAKNQSGMQAVEELHYYNKNLAKTRWRFGSQDAIALAINLAKDGCHKAIANRVLEPFSHITVIITATYFNNFFALRAHPMAQQEFQVLAFRMLDDYLRSVPQKLPWNTWHLPYTTGEDAADLVRDHDFTQIVKVSAARCARVSYLNQDGKRDISADLELHDRLIAQVPKHASALEHPAKAIEDLDSTWEAESPSNFHPSWRQYRKMIPFENIEKFDLQMIMDNKPNWITL